MNPAIAAMMADLGNERRDILSAPVEGKDDYRGRARQERLVRLQAEDRRANAHVGARNESEAELLKAWNTAATFGGDEVAEQLENRFGGQGHRAQLQQTVGSRRHESAEAPGPIQRSRRDFAQDDEDRRAYQQDRQNRVNAPDPSRKRASSPRASGKVKFRNGQRVPAGPPGVLAAAASIPRTAFDFSAPAPSSAASVASRPFAQTQNKTTTTPSPSQTPLSPAPVPPHAQVPAPVATQPPAQTVNTSVITTPTAPQPARTRLVSQSTTNTASSGPRTSAITPAAAPKQGAVGSLSGVGVLNSIWEKLNKTKVTSAASQMTAAEEMAAEGLSAASTTVKLNSTSDKLPAATTGPSQAPSVITAGSEFTTIPIPHTLPAKAWNNLSTDPTSLRNKMWALCDAAEEDDRAHKWPANDIHFLYEARAKIAEDVVLLAQPDHSEKAREYFNVHKDRAWLQYYAVQARAGHTEHAETNPMVIEIVKATDQLYSRDVAVPTALATNKLQPISARPPTPPSTASNSAPGSIAGDETTDMSTPPYFEVAKGSLGATFYDHDGTFRGNRQYPLDTPVLASVTITAKNGEYDVLGMSDSMDMLANAISRRKLIREQNGYSLSDNGMYFDGH